MKHRESNCRKNGTFAVHTVGVPVSATEQGNQLRHAILGFRLADLCPLSLSERISRQALLVTRATELGDGLLGEGIAIELRYIVDPLGSLNRFQESITCYLLLRLTRWSRSNAALRNKAVRRAIDTAALLESTIPEYLFLPVKEVAELKRSLVPFTIRDTIEVRRRSLDVPGMGMLPLPLQGTMDLESVLDLMARQSSPIMLSLCIAPCCTVEETNMSGETCQKYNDVGSPMDGGHLPTAVPTSRLAEDQRVFFPKADCDAAGVLDSANVVFQETWLQPQLLALHMASFLLRIQMSSSTHLAESIVATVTREVGGPSRLTAEAAWQMPMLPVAGGADWARPRSARTRGQRQSEFAIACSNQATLEFVPWGDRCLRANLGEVACSYALPATGKWLPAKGIADLLPCEDREEKGLHLGFSRSLGVDRQVFQSPSSRHHHLCIVGQSGTGKSTLLENIVLQDILDGRGVIVIDPYGNLIRQILGKIPFDRAEDVILFDPADNERPLGLNPLESCGQEELDVLVNAFIDLTNAFYSPHDTEIIKPLLEHCVRKVALTVMSTSGNSLIEILRAFQDDTFVPNSLLANIADPLWCEDWTSKFSQSTCGRNHEVINRLVSKFIQFASDQRMYSILGQSRSSFSFREAMDTGKIVLVSLAQGVLGSENTKFLGVVLLSMILRAVASRTELPVDQQRDVSLVIDEFHNCATDSLVQMLTKASEYRQGLILANQHLGQLKPGIREAVLGNVGSILAFRLRTSDALIVQSLLAPSLVSAEHLIALPNFTAYGRLREGAQRTPAFMLQTQPSPIEYDEACATAIRHYSRMRYGRPRDQVVQELASRSNF